MATKVVKITYTMFDFLFNKLTSTGSRRRMRKSKESTCLLRNSIPCPEYFMNAKRYKGGAALWLRERASIDFTLTIATNCSFFCNTTFLSKQLRKSRVWGKIRYQVNYSTYFWFTHIVNFSRANEIGNEIYLINNVERIVVPIMRSLCS